MNFYGMTDDAIALELGARIQRQRLNRNKSQEQIAEAVGVSKPTIVQLERGQAKLTTLIAVMRALGMLDQVDQIVPEVPASPVQVLKMSGVVRKRASGKVVRANTGQFIGKVATGSKVTHSKRVTKDKSEW
ncbi:MULTISPECIES: helix-turn-helix domain-containing protein [Pseudomonas]|uniref:Transcriptional regulator n=1 Tax=Pseudomonas fluorescens TaxID=294 RepID=A0A162B2D0_PSEFL|nr:helix-turn-helix transcriptional regulator [Pseudomonas sp. FW300-N1B4]KZN20636.1 transcriptional regulator [Pseudomonas fluorescens]